MSVREFIFKFFSVNSIKAVIDIIFSQIENPNITCIKIKQIFKFFLGDDSTFFNACWIALLLNCKSSGQEVNFLKSGLVFRNETSNQLSCF